MFQGQKEVPTECAYWTGSRQADLTTEVGTEWDSGASASVHVHKRKCVCMCVHTYTAFWRYLGKGLSGLGQWGNVLTRCVRKASQQLLKSANFPRTPWELD